VTRTRELLAVLMHAQVGGFFGTPPGLDGEPGIGLVGVHGVPRARSWEAVASAHAPDLPGDTATFVVLAEGTVVVEDDLPDGALIPLADALEGALQPPYRAAAIRHEADVWTAVAETVAVVELRGVEEDVAELTIVDGQRTLTLDGETTIRPLAALDALAELHGEVVLHAERVDGELYAVDVFPL
jgi:hypothetical protein